MHISDLTVRLIALLIPGAIAALIVDKLTSHRPWRPFSFVVNSVLLGVSAYSLYQLVLFLWGFMLLLFTKTPSFKYLTFWSAIFDTSKLISLGEVAWTGLFGIACGYLCSAFLNHKILFTIAKYLHVSKRFGDEDVWEYLMLSPDVEWVWVRDHTRNLVYEGYIQAFSDTTPLREILLSEVKVYSNESSELLYKIPILYLGRNPNELTIEIPPISREEGGQHNAEGNN